MNFCPRNRIFADGALGGGESFIQQAGLTIASCGSYVNPLVLDAADGTRGGGESLMVQAGLMIASCGSYVNPGCPDAVSDSLMLSGTCSGNHSTEGRLTGDASLSHPGCSSTFEGSEHPCSESLTHLNGIYILCQWHDHEVVAFAFQWKKLTFILECVINCCPRIRNFADG